MLNTVCTLNFKLLTKKVYSDLGLWALILIAYYDDRMRCEFIKMSICDRPLYFNGQWIQTLPCVKFCIPGGQWTFHCKPWHGSVLSNIVSEIVTGLKCLRSVYLWHYFKSGQSGLLKARLSIAGVILTVVLLSSIRRGVTLEMRALPRIPDLGDLPDSPPHLSQMSRVLWGVPKSNRSHADISWFVSGGETILTLLSAATAYDRKKNP